MLRIEVSRWGQPLGVSEQDAKLVRIGSAADNDLVLDHAEVAPHHLEVYLWGEQVYGCSPDGRPLRIAGKRVRAASPLDGHPIPLGDFSLLISLQPAGSAEARAQRLGRARLSGNDLIPLPPLDVDARDLLEARRILRGQGSSARRLKRLARRGLPLAREIVEQHARKSLSGTAGEVREVSERRRQENEVRAAAAQRARRGSGRRWTAPLLVLALLTLAWLTWGLFELSLSFTE